MVALLPPFQVVDDRGGVLLGLAEHAEPPAVEPFGSAHPLLAFFLWHIRLRPEPAAVQPFGAYLQKSSIPGLRLNEQLVGCHAQRGGEPWNVNHAGETASGFVVLICG